MGFGILFFGYFITFLLSLNAYGPIFALIGNYLIFVALQKLSEYKHSLTRCIPFLLLMAICNLVGSVEVLFSMELGIAGLITETVSLVSSLLFNIFLFLSIISLGEDTEVAEVKSLAKLNIAATSIYFTANLAMMILATYEQVLAAAVLLNILAVAMFLRLIFPLFALALIYKCFRFICAPEDVDMPIKPSRFKFINEFRERQAKKEEETRRSREELLTKEKQNSGTHPHTKHKKKK